MAITTNEVSEGIKAPPVSPEAKKSALDELMRSDFMTKMKEQIAGIREKVGTEISNFKKKNSLEKVETVKTPEKPESIKPKETPNTTPESEIVLNPNAPYQVPDGGSTTTTNVGSIGGSSIGTSPPPPTSPTNSF